MHVVIVDNYDSFVFNLVDEFAGGGCSVEVYRNSASADVIEEAVLRSLAQRKTLLVLSPGPGRPAGAGCCAELVRRLAPVVPIFGVCLGHQILVEAFGGEVDRAGEVIHGKVSRIAHDGRGVFEGLANPLTVGRYHSLAAARVPQVLEVTARTDTGIAMAVRHRERPIVGVQFHPESILTPAGRGLVQNMMALVSAGAREEA